VEKIWADINQLVDEYGFNLDIVYTDPDLNAYLSKHYDKIFFWNEPIA